MAYHLSTVQYHILLFLIILPVVAIWFVAFYGYTSMRGYSELIRKSGEGGPFKDISTSLAWLAWSLPLTSLVNLIVGAIANSHAGFYNASQIINNYASLLVAIVAFSILGTGSRRLLEREKLRISANTTKTLILGFVVIGTIYCYLVFHDLGNKALGSANNPYYLPVWLLMFTVVMPYLYAWFVGLLAAYEIRLLSKHAKGLLYQQALQHFARGVIVIVASSIALQYLLTTSPRSNYASLGYLVLIIYCILVLLAVGYGLLAFGAKKLKKLEEV
ncbi:MAG TPA: hypothetical protein VLG13_03680 [Patescibacteria group bacterium]|nr:hypothetical protein [Patescibacteria group bacterium]